MIGFSTANRICETGEFCEMTYIHESQIDKAFRAVAEATEEAVLHSMLKAESVVGYQNHIKRSLTEFL
jgi:D-aminopeptidase